GHDAGAGRGGGPMSRLRPVAVPWSAAWLMLGLLGAACASRPSADPLRGPLRSSRITFQLAGYYLPAPTSDPLPPLDSLLARDFPGLRRVAQLPATDRGRFVAARMERDVQGSYVPPEGTRLLKRGLSPEQATALRSSREALLLDFRIAGEPPWKGLRAACLV